jgi:plastocyanin
VLGISLGRAVSGSDDKHDDDHDDDDRNDRKSDDDVRASGTAPAGSAEVIIDDDDADGFAPGTITIDVGGSVTWTNLDKDPHTATGADFDTGIMQPGDLATVTFDEPGRYPYSCQLHPVMTGTVEVRDGSGVVPGATPQATPAASPQAGQAEVTEVGIDNLAFDPDDLTVTVGTTVRWTNREAIPHTVRSSSNEFDSGIMEEGDTFEYTFDTAGVIDYICGLHPSMKARVTVEG